MTNNKNYLMLNTRKNKINEEIKIVDYKDLENMVFRLELTDREIEKVLDMKYIDTSIIGYTLPPGIYENSDTNSKLKHLLPDEVKANISTDYIRVKSNLPSKNTNKLTKKILFLQKN